MSRLAGLFAVRILNIALRNGFTAKNKKILTQITVNRAIDRFLMKKARVEAPSRLFGLSDWFCLKTQLGLLCGLVVSLMALLIAKGFAK